MFKAVFASVAVLALTTAASAQVIYEPIRYQHALGDDQVLYYGGSNPRVIENARRTYQLYNQPRATTSRAASRTTIRKGLTGGGPYVYSDVAPYMNLSLYGFDAADARNEAYANAPTYFRKLRTAPRRPLCRRRVVRDPRVGQADRRPRRAAQPGCGGGDAAGPPAGDHHHPEAPGGAEGEGVRQGRRAGRVAADLQSSR